MVFPFACVVPKEVTALDKKATNAIERFFRAFNRFYKMRCGFFTVTDTVGEFVIVIMSEAKNLPCGGYLGEILRFTHNDKM